jgi:hypothetical protein
MISNHAELSEDCQRELGRSMHMAFFVWQPRALLTAPCDADIQQFCLSKSKGMEIMPGAVAVCISEIVSAALRTAYAKDCIEASGVLSVLFAWLACFGVYGDRVMLEATLPHQRQPFEMQAKLRKPGPAPVPHTDTLCHIICT